jgi:hypothetical protein
MYLSRLSAFIIAVGFFALSAVPATAQEKKPVRAEFIRIEAKDGERAPVPPNKKDVEAVLKRLQATLARGYRAWPPLDDDGAYIVLLSNKSVQEELGLTDEQKDKLKNVRARLGENLEKLVADFDKNKLQKRNPEERDKDALGIIDSMMKESHKAATDILLPGQAKRFQQIEWQDSGLIVFKNADIQTGLKLGKDQKNKIDMILGEYYKQLQQLSTPKHLKEMKLEDFPSSEGALLKKLEERHLTLEALVKVAEKNLYGVLTEDQETAFKALLGPPFKIVR